MAYTIKSPRKLIEVALPLDAISDAAGKEKATGQGHPSTLHLWWARRPLGTARAVIFSQLVNDPGYQQGGGFKYGKNKRDAAEERKRLFKIIEDLVQWENTTREDVLQRARAEIRRSWIEVCELNKDHPQAATLFNSEKPPALHDPFAGGGAIPLEAQRLGLDSYATDLNPVAVILNKAMIEFPPKFAGRQPVGPLPAGDNELIEKKDWPGASGLAEDIRRYGTWMREEANRRIGHLYPQVEITTKMAAARPDLKGLVGQKLTVIAWLWARTVKSPNPAFKTVEVPLASTFVLSTKTGKGAYVEPVIDGNRYDFQVRFGQPPATAENGTKAKGRGANFRCLISDALIDSDYIRAEGRANRIGQRLMAVVLEGSRGRVYVSPTPQMEAVAAKANPKWKPDVEFYQQALGFRVGNYGMTKWSDLFTPRQLLALSTFCDLATEIREKARHDAVAAGVPDDKKGLQQGGVGATAYAEAVSVYLAFVIDRLAMTGNSLVRWNCVGEKAQHCFGRQTLSMLWDFAEPNFLGTATGSIDAAVFYTYDPITRLPCNGKGVAEQNDAQTQRISTQKIVATDPPYYDNIGYADLSDFFYVWLRHVLKPVFPSLLATIAVPKAEELVATPSRHGSAQEAEAFFLLGMTKAISSISSQAHEAFPISIYYAFKQSETDEKTGTTSTGWVTFLEAVQRAGLQITGTWPMRTEMATRMRGMDSNALASSIVLVCRKRAADAPTISRRDFIRELNQTLPEALDEMTNGSGDNRSPVAPVDLSQAIIGPGMAVFSKHSAVLEADGSSMSVRTALQLINRFLAEDDFDADTQFCLRWFDDHGWKEGPFGEADTLARSKTTSVDGVSEAGIINSKRGKVRLLGFNEYPSDWDPRKDKRIPVWEALHHLIRSLKQDGESGAGRLLAQIKAKAEPARQLAYRLYTLCERQGWAEDARAYNEIITSWAAIETAASTVPVEEQPTLFGESQ